MVNLLKRVINESIPLICRLTKERDAQVQLLEELSREVERLRLENRTPALPTTSAETIRLEELHEEMSALRAENSQLLEMNEELQANLLHAGLEQGRKLTAGENSLAAELDAMTQDEVCILLCNHNINLF